MKPGFVLKTLILSVVWSAVLLFSAGTSRWLYAWIYIIGSLALVLVSSLLLHRNAPAIAAERSGAPFQQDQTIHDKIVLLIMIMTHVCLMIVAGIDRRLGWSDVPGWMRIIGAAFIAITYYTTYRVALENEFAAPVVKIQKSRGHKVIDTGPYQYVRHPMYTGLVFRSIGTPLLLGSWWGLCPASMLIILMVIRILFEERTLRTGLEGYNRYIERVPYRLVPLVW
jgi:protein-S-isoprenylcysteine O-methyltransferase Ste14